MDRVRCARCRNPIRPHQAVAGPVDGARTYHEDCWLGAELLGAPGTCELQRDYQSRVAAEGLAALLAPYLTPGPVRHAAAGAARTDEVAV